MNERERANTTYYDAQSNFGTPPKDGSGDYRGGMVNRKKSNPIDAEQDVLYERIHKEQRYNQYQRRDSPQKVVTTVQHSIVRSPNSNGMISRMGSGGPVHMPPMSSSHDYSSGIAGRAHSGSDDPRWQSDDFKPGPRANSAANIDALFHKNKWHSTSTTVTQLPPAPRREYVGGPNREDPNSAQLMFVRRNREVTGVTPPKNDYGVVGAYSQDNAYRAEQIMYGKSGSVRQHGHEYELDPRLNVTYPQYYVDDWKDRHARDTRFVPRHNSSFNKAHPPPQQVPRPRFASDASNNRHVYEEVPMGGHYEPANGYERNSPRQDERYRRDKETAILDDYDNVPNEFLNTDKNMTGTREDDANFDTNSDVYQPGRYQPSEDAGSSSDEDDPEYLELIERDSIINRYEKGPDDADVDPWENPNFEVYTKSDRFGFLHKGEELAGEKDDAHKRRVLKELSRDKKWLKMIEVWKSGGPSKKMEDRIWKGIPKRMRIVVWPRLLNADRIKYEKKDVYAELLLRARLVSKDIKQIDLDINRTYRDHVSFRKRYDLKQKSLLNVLAAYSMYNTEVGYCQGMSQIAALFLMYLDEEEAFWCLHQLMVSPKHTMHGFFVPGFPKLQRFEEHFKKVLKKYKPRVYKHLEKQDIPYIYLTKWWFGCFLDRVPFSLALRLWDAFLVEGDPILIAMALNIMKMHEKTIRKLTLETFMEFIQNDIAVNFGYSDDETMHSLRETMAKLKSDRMHVPPPPRPEDLSEVPTKALGPVLHKQMSQIREEIHEIQSRRSRANSTGRSPHPKRKESSRQQGPPPVQHKWNGAASQDSINQGKEVPFEIPTRRQASSPASTSDASFANGHASKRDGSPRYHHNQHPARSGRESSNGTPAMQRLRDERNGKMVMLSRASDSDGDVSSPMSNRDTSSSWHESKVSGSTRITQTTNNVTRIELDGDVSVI